MTTPPDNTLFPGLRDALVHSVIPYAQHMAQRFAHNDHRDSTPDLFSAALHGAVIASRRWSPEYGVKFVSYASWYMRQAIQTEIAQLTSHGLVAVSGHSVSRDWRGCRTPPDVMNTVVNGDDEDFNPVDVAAAHAWDDTAECWGDDAWEHLESQLGNDGMRTAFILCFRRGMSQREASGWMGITRRAVAYYVSSAIAILRAVVDEMEAA